MTEPMFVVLGTSMAKKPIQISVFTDSINGVWHFN